jgi:hypothetical protein
MEVRVAMTAQLAFGHLLAPLTGASAPAAASTTGRGRVGGEEAITDTRHDFLTQVCDR